MKVILHKAEQRGRGDHGPTPENPGRASWLSTRYSFSFADWYEPNRMGFGKLRVINDDTIAPASGFGEHGHRDMEIITIVTEGTVTHTDSMGNVGEVSAGEVQVMSAGTGVVHSERNKSPDTILKLFQIWIEPKEFNISPRYGQKKFDFKNAEGEILLVAPDADSVGSPQAASGALGINQDAYISYAAPAAGAAYTYKIKKPGNGVYIFIIEGTMEIEGNALANRDAVGVSETDTVEIKVALTDSTGLSQAGSRLLLIDVPME